MAFALSSVAAAPARAARAAARSLGRASGVNVAPLRASPRVARSARMSGVGVAAFFGSKSAEAEEGVYALTVETIDGKSVPLSKFKGKALLIVNSASACGFTPQQKGLAELAKKYQGKLEVILQPCNQFGGQDPGSNADIKRFAAGNGVGVGGAGVLLAKADVNGPDASPLFQYLRKEKGGILGSDIKWNFTKFLTDKNGKVVGRYAPTTTPEALEKDILAAIA